MKLDISFDFIRTERFYYFFYFMIGLFIVLVFRNSCKGDDCIEHKNVDINEITSSIYQIGSNCYQFTTKSV